MKRADLLQSIASQANISVRQADDALCAMLDKITDVLAIEQEVRIAGFGTFAVAQRAARQGIHPQTGALIQIAAQKRPIFRPAKHFKLALQTTPGYNPVNEHNL